MRLSIITFLFVLSTAPLGSAYGQTNEGPPGGSALFSPGTMFAGGSVTYTFEQTDEDEVDDKLTSHTISFTPQFGYFLTKNIAVFGVLVFSKEMSEQGATESTLSAYGFGAGIGYFLPLKEKLSLYVTGQVDYGLVEAETVIPDVPLLGDVKKELEGDTIGVTGRVGLLYMLRANLGLELGLQVEWRKTTLEDDDTVLLDLTTKETATNFALGYLGVRAFF